MSKKILMSFLIIALMVASIGTSVFAKQTDELTKNEINTLINDVGLTEEEIGELPIDVLKELIELDAVKIAAPGKKYYDLESETPEVSTMELSSSDITINGLAFEIASDWPGYSRLYLYGSFEWLISPWTSLTDMMTIGYSSVNNFIIATDGSGNPMHFQSVFNEINILGGTTYHTSSIPYTTSSSGVAQLYESDARVKYGTYGTMTQYVYVQDSSPYTSANVWINYGHSTGSIPSLQIGPFGLAPTGSGVENTTPYIMFVQW